MNKQNEYVSFETAKSAYKKGFDEYCNKYYIITPNKSKGKLCITHSNLNNSEWDSYRIKNLTDNIAAPTKYILDMWLLENYSIQITIFSCSQESWQFKITRPHEKLEDVKLYEDFTSKSEAIDNALQEALKLI